MGNGSLGDSSFARAGNATAAAEVPRGYHIGKGVEAAHGRDVAQRNHVPTRQGKGRADCQGQDRGPAHAGARLSKREYR